jgi:hypothetical protein
VKVLVTGRRGGKTTAMLAWLRANPEAVCICLSTVEASRLAQENTDIARERFLTVDGTRKLEGMIRPQVGVDNADIILARYLGVMPDFATVNDEPIL